MDLKCSQFRHKVLICGSYKGYFICQGHMWKELEILFWITWEKLMSQREIWYSEKISVSIELETEVIQLKSRHASTGRKPEEAWDRFSPEPLKSVRPSWQNDVTQWNWFQTLVSETAKEKKMYILVTLFARVCFNMENENKSI